MAQGTGGLLCDEFDSCAHNYAAYDDSGEVVGSVRVVPDGPLGLPLEHCLPLNGFRDGKRLAEISRLAVAPEHRSSRLPALLMKAGYQRCLHIGVTHITLDTFIDGADSGSLYDRMGFTPLGDPYLDPSYDCGEHVLSLSLSVEDALRQLTSKHPGLFRFFTSADAAIDHIE
jgi:GNAT superfamily N-acetyltransferase